jgi:hypothetical protein
MRPRPRRRPKSRWSALATAVIITAGMGLAALAAPPRALAENNGLVVSAPLMGWSTWNDVAYHPSASKDEAEASALKSSGLTSTADEIADGDSENNYNCGGMQGIGYSTPGAQAFINSWADELASWGVDYLKLDGVGSFDIPDAQAWSTALNGPGPTTSTRSRHINVWWWCTCATTATTAIGSRGWQAMHVRSTQVEE